MMLLKESVIGIKIDLSGSQDSAFPDENVVNISGKKVLIKSKYIGELEPREKFAVLGESPFYLRKEGILSIIGPTTRKKYLVSTNSRGYQEKFFVSEEDVLFLR
jgi:hypothetical protein